MDSSANTPASARRLPRAIDMMRAFSKPRQTQHIPTVISAPMGPVKSSRGVDLVRSDTLTIVTGIDNETNEAVTPTPTQHKVTEVRRSFTTSGKTASVFSIPKLSNGLKGVNSSTTGKPTVASSTVTATTTPLQTLSYNQKASSRRASLKPSISVPLLDLKHPKHVLPSLVSVEPTVQDENTPPANDSGPAYAHPAYAQQVTKQPPATRMSKLPKSRTMGVLQELKASISRPSTVLSRARQSSHVSIPTIKSTPSTDSAKTEVPHSTDSSRLWLTHASLTSLVRSSRSATPEPVRPDQVVSAQPSAYWTGRFLALHDRFLSEALDERSSFNRPNDASGSPKPRNSSLQDRTERGTQREYTMKNSTSQLPFSNKTALPHANTTSSLSRVMFKSSVNGALNEDDDRCHRVFNRLEESCLTTEARQSLRDWQQAYARKENRPMLLPDGRVMDEKNRVVRFFSSNSGTKKRHPQQRQSLPGVPHLGKKASKSDAILGAVRDKSLIVL